VDARLSLAALFALALCACRSGSAAIPEARADESSSATTPGIAVVELFTSEGCSSCPPADVLLSDLERQNRSIFVLEFHVDYWDTLGWPDRFSSPDWTARQRAYSRSFGTSELYTPEMIVGGTDPFNGTDRGRAAVDVARSLAQAPLVHLSIRSRPAGSEAIAVDFDAPGAPAGATVAIAAVQREATTEVRAGENQGRTLRHVNVVRAFGVARLPGSTLTLHLPKSLRRSDAEIVAFVQRESGGATGMPILAAARSPLAPLPE
jgi:hypothetical protein